jgi:hypothetical protein
VTTITQADLTNIISEAWQLAGAAVASLPPLLRDDDLTIKGFYEAHKEDLTSENEARALLEDLASKGRLVKVECRSGRGHGRVMAYRLPEKEGKA